MAVQAKCPDIGQVAGSASFGDGEDVIGVPQSAAVDCLQTPLLQQTSPRNAAAALERQVSRDGVYFANGAHTPVAGERPLPKKVCVGSKAPLLDAEVGAESDTSSRNL